MIKLQNKKILLALLRSSSLYNILKNDWNQSIEQNMTMSIKCTNKQMLKSKMKMLMFFMGNSHFLPAGFKQKKLNNSIRKDPLSNLNSKQTRVPERSVNMFNKITNAKNYLLYKKINFYNIFYNCLTKLKLTTCSMIKLQEKMESKFTKDFVPGILKNQSI